MSQEQETITISRDQAARIIGLLCSIAVNSELPGEKDSALKEAEALMTALYPMLAKTRDRKDEDA